jgi:uncharacterized protein YycO
MKGWNPFGKKLTTQITHQHCSELTEVLKKGDVLGYRIMQKGDAISRLVNNMIALFTKSIYFHVEIYLGGGWSVTAGKHGVHFSDSVVHTSNFDALRLKRGLTEEEADTIGLYCYKQVGKPYDYLATLLMPFASPKKLAKRSVNEAWMCSELTAWCYRRIGIDLVPGFEEVSAIAPVDIISSDQLEYLGSWHKGKPVPDGALHKRNRFQKEPGMLSYCIVRSIVNPLSEKDEFRHWMEENQAGMLKDSEKV